MLRFARKLIAVILGLSVLAGELPAGNMGSIRNVYAEGETINVTSNGAYEEGVYAQWESVAGANGYIVYAKKDTDDAGWQKLDNELIRQYEDGWRVDAVGLSAGDWRLRIEAGAYEEGNFVQLATKTLPEMRVKPFDRTGYAWSESGDSSVTEANGAYNKDGSLKAEADVVYLTQTNKNTVKLTVGTGESIKSYTGIADILKRYAPVAEQPLDIRIVGMITGGGDLKKYSNFAGDLLLEKSKNITIEGIGEDAVAYGWGVRLEECSNVEVRNIGFLGTNSDQGNSVSINKSNHIWVHNCDFFYGDSAEGIEVAATKCVESDCVTFSYNHFHDNALSQVLGGGTADETNLRITTHHNWFDHSDVGNPLIREYSVHAYNNFYEGNSGYGIGASMNASVFAEKNYFSGCVHPMLIAGQGAGAGVLKEKLGGITKAYGNKISNGQYVAYGYDEGESDIEFDAVFVSGSAIVANTIKTKSGSFVYNNFDLSAQMYSYNADTAMEVPILAKLQAGRHGGGDLKWEFTSRDNASSTPNAELKKKITDYESPIISIGGMNTAGCAKPFLVHLDSQGGERNYDIKITSGEIMILDQAPVYAGHRFLGWYTQISGGEEVKILDGGVLDDDITLYAHWGDSYEPPVKEEFTVDFVDEDGNSIEGIISQQVEAGGYVTMPNPPSRENSDFIGWYLGNAEWDFESDTVHKDITLVARFFEQERYFILMEDENGVLREDVILEYTGEAKSPLVNVCFGTSKTYKKLVEGKDYSVTYKNNKSASVIHNFYADGEYSDSKPMYSQLITDPAKLPKAIIKFKGNYAGVAEKEFGIAKRKYESKEYGCYSIKGATVSLYMDGAEGANAVTAVPYAGVPVRFESIKLSLQGAAKEALGDVVEVVGSDQFSVAYSKNKSKGTATVTISGTGDLFEGTVKKTFKILPAEIGNADGFTSLELGFCYASYAKGGAKPELELSFGNENKPLVEGIDYTVICKDNKGVTSEDGTVLGKKPTITIKGKGNFTGSVTYNYKIMQADFSGMNISAPDVAYSDAKGKFASKVSVVERLPKGKKLAEKKDYYLDYFICDENGTRLSDIPLDRKFGRVEQPCYIMASITPASDFFTGEADLIYRSATPQSMISKATFVVKDKNWNSDGVTLEPDDFIFASLGDVGGLRYGEDYEIVPGTYSKNNVKGTAKVTVRGIGKYAGEKIVSFKIKPMLITEL